MTIAVWINMTPQQNHKQKRFRYTNFLATIIIYTYNAYCIMFMNIMFTRITCSYRSKIVKAMLQCDIVGLFVNKRPLESHQERVGEYFAGASRGDENRSGDALQPHDHCGHRRLTEAGLPLTSLNIDPKATQAPKTYSQIIKDIVLMLQPTYCVDLVYTHLDKA